MMSLDDPCVFCDNWMAIELLSCLIVLVVLHQFMLFPRFVKDYMNVSSLSPTVVMLKIVYVNTFIQFIMRIKNALVV